MLRLYVRDEQTGLTVECPLTENHKGDSPIVSVDWPLEDAVKTLVDKVARHLTKPAMEVMLGGRTAFKIVAKWTVE